MIGLESTPAEYLDRLVAVFDEVKRVMRGDGILFLNIGDSYCSAKGRYSQKPQTISGNKDRGDYMKDCRPDQKKNGWQDKTLMLMPERLLIRLQDSGWIVRSKIIWCKKNPMPESVQDRPTSAWEYVYMLTKSGRYTYDAEAVKEKPTESTIKRVALADNRLEVENEIKAALTDGYKRCDEAKVNVDKYGGGVDHLVCAPSASGRNARNYWTMEDPNGEGEYVIIKAKREDLKEMGFQLNDVPDIFHMATEPNRYVMCSQCGKWYESRPLQCNACGYHGDKWGGHYACVDSETEILTEYGWRKHNEIRIGDRCAQYLTDSGKLRWDRIDGINIYQVKDIPMRQIKGKHLDMLLTENHRNIVFRNSGHQGKNGLKQDIVKTKDIKNKYKILIAAEWDKDISIKVDHDIAELIGWYISEGHQPKGTKNQVYIYQSVSANLKKVKRIKWILDNLKADYKFKESTRIYKGEETKQGTFTINGYYNRFLRHLCPDKRLPYDVLKWDIKALERLLYGLIEGDGTRRKTGNRCSFIQKDKTIIDIVQAVAFKCGIPSTIGKKEKENIYYLNFSNRKLISLRGSKGINNKNIKVNYSGVVWCPTTKAGTFVARRNGKIFITGNSFPRELVRRCLKPVVSEGGCCEKCGKMWRRIIEKSKINERPHKLSQGKIYEAIQSNDKQIGVGGGFSRSGIQFEWQTQTLGFMPACTCNAGSHGRPVILDPFAGSFTTGVVAIDEFDCDFIGIELSKDYCNLGEMRLSEATNQLKLFAEVQAT